jgi:hypothetical protein
MSYKTNGEATIDSAFFCIWLYVSCAEVESPAAAQGLLQPIAPAGAVCSS